MTDELADQRDLQLEEKIDRVGKQALDMLAKASELYALQRWLIAQRSPAQIAKMELEKGLV